jgi:hypothetical protein
MMGSDEECGGSRKPGAENRGWSSIGRVLGSRTIERSGHAMCGLYHARGDEERGFLGLASMFLIFMVTLRFTFLRCGSIWFCVGRSDIFHALSSSSRINFLHSLGLTRLAPVVF